MGADGSAQPPAGRCPWVLAPAPSCPSFSWPVRNCMALLGLSEVLKCNLRSRVLGTANGIFP